MAEGSSLPFAERGQGNIHVAADAVDNWCPSRIGSIARQIAGGLAVPDDKERTGADRRFGHSRQIAGRK
jgi:hypothetical protein